MSAQEAHFLKTKLSNKMSKNIQKMMIKHNDRNELGNNG